METSSNAIIVNGREITQEELLEIQKDPKKKLKKLSESTYTVLELMHG